MMLHARRATLTACCALLAAPAWAQNAVNVFPPPTGLKHQDVKPAFGLPAQVSRTSPDANWSVAFPSMPDKVGPIVGNGTANRWGSSTYVADGTVEIAQHGAGLPCSKLYESNARLVDEFDGFITPPSIPNAQAIPLSRLQSAVLNGTVTAWASGPADFDCKMNVVVPMDAFTLFDSKTGDVLFYQLKLGSFVAGAGGGLHSKMPSSGWFATGRSQQTAQTHNWGFDDAAPAAFQTALMQSGVPLHYSVDLLPRLEAVLQNGAQHGLDPDPADWAINAEYVGNSLFGHVDVRTRWSGLSLMETPLQ